MDVDELLNGARCLTSCLPPGLLFEVKTHLLCQIVENLPSPEPPAPECDQDALDFIAAANITNVTNQNAICAFVKDLKAYPAVGTKFWDRDYIIYPFVSNPGDSNAQRAASHSINLKSPGNFTLLYPGVGLTHSDLGMAGNGGATAYANTQYTPTTSTPVWTVNNSRGFMYVDSKDNTIGVGYYGAWQAGNINRIAHRISSASGGSDYHEMNTNGSAYVLAPSRGAGGYCMKQVSGEIYGAYNGAAFNGTAGAVITSKPNQPLYLLAFNNAGAPSTRAVARLSGFSIGLPFSDAEWAEYHFIWQKFQAALSVPRARP
jgi:hypothetical protein